MCSCCFSEAGSGNDIGLAILCRVTGRSSLFHMNDKHLQAFALAYLIGWLLSRMPKKN